MFYLNRNEELNEKLLNKMINRFNINVKPQLERSKQ